MITPTETAARYILPAPGEWGVALRMDKPGDVINALAHDVKLSGMPIAMIAAKCAVSPSTVRRALRPDGKGKVETLMRIAWAIGRDLRISFTMRGGGGA